MSRKIIFDECMTMFDTVNLGTLLAALERNKERDDVDPGESRDRTLYFDFGGLVPDYLDSYRGYYNHLAITS